MLVCIKKVISEKLCLHIVIGLARLRQAWSLLFLHLSASYQGFSVEDAHTFSSRCWPSVVIGAS